MKLLYFAWLRQQIGRSEEIVTPPEQVITIADLLDWLEGCGPNYAKALANRDLVRVAINQEFAPLDYKVTNCDEIALFPPMTGG